MGGFNAKNQRSLKALGADNAAIGVWGSVHKQPPPFRATGRGWFNRVPNFPATVLNSNAALVNRAASQDAKDLYKIYLFVNAISTGFSVAGEYGQAQGGRAFYPRNYSQDDLVIEGQVANQYEYDKLVRFVAHHHITQFTNSLRLPLSLTNDSYPGVYFTLYRPVNSSLSTFEPIRYVVSITDITAGHERFKNMPSFALQCKVLYDYLEDKTEVFDDINKIVTRQQIYGDAVNPAPTTAASGAPSSATTARAPSVAPATGAPTSAVAAPVPQRSFGRVLAT